MTDKKSDIRAGCSVKAAPVPLAINCSECGAMVEMWSDETETACGACGASIAREV